MSPVVKALGCRSGGGSALDVGCGAGGGIVQTLGSHGYDVTGLDVSAEMIRLAAANHPQSRFIHQDVSVWDTARRFEFNVAWDSSFHLPVGEQRSVIEKLCRWLAEGGVLIYTFGSASGEHTDNWRDDTFFYSSIGMDEHFPSVNVAPPAMQPWDLLITYVWDPAGVLLHFAEKPEDAG